MRSNGSWLQPPPAIAAITSTAPKVRSVNATSASTCERSVTSVRSARALPPSAVTAPTVACSRSSSREATTTCAPAAANAVATPRPTLKPPPVTIATLPRRGCAAVIVAAVRSGRPMLATEQFAQMSTVACRGRLWWRRRDTSSRTPGSCGTRAFMARRGPLQCTPVPLVRSFPPIASKNARLLVLGSMPGEASLAAGQYYANPRNAFWPIAGELFGFDPRAPYRRLVASLRACGVAVWDVLACCERDGSLDSHIAPASMLTNDFAAFFARHRRVRDVCCNGGTA